MGVYPQKKARFYTYICRNMTHFRQSTQHQLPAYQYAYGNKTVSGVCLQTITDYSPFGVTLDGRTMQGDQYKYSFQGQEHDDEVKGEGNSVNYKYRMHDPRVGRFFAVDPLTMDYPYYTPYQFSGNSTSGSREIEGLEPNISFNSVEEAAKNFGQMYNGKSILNGVEYGTNIYKVTTGGASYYYYEEPNKGTAASVTYPATYLKKGTRVATIHAHGEYLTKYKNNLFSDTDKSNAEDRGVDNYVATPNGSLKHYDVETNKVDVISTDLPSDPKDPDRKNKVKPELNPKSPVLFYHDPYIPTDKDPNIIYDNLDPNYYNPNILSIPIKKFEFKVN